MDPIQFLELVIRPTLQAIGLPGVAAEELLLGTAMQESRLRYLRQLGRGPALGVYQMEPATHRDIWENYLGVGGRHELERKVRLLYHPYADRQRELVTNLAYATAMARVHYKRVAEPLPQAGDVMGQARYWKAHYNTPLGAGTVDEYVRNFQEVLG